jgi:hypothetical protein
MKAAGGTASWRCFRPIARLQPDYGLVEKNGLYRCLDKLLEHKTALFDHLDQRWQDLFGASFEVLLYDLTSTYRRSRHNRCGPKYAIDFRHTNSLNRPGSPQHVPHRHSRELRPFELTWPAASRRSAIARRLSPSACRLLAMATTSGRSWACERRPSTLTPVARFRSRAPRSLASASQDGCRPRTVCRS